jgi:hypothetical protein
MLHRMKGASRAPVCAETIMVAPAPRRTGAPLTSSQLARGEQVTRGLRLAAEVKYDGYRRYAESHKERLACSRGMATIGLKNSPPRSTGFGARRLAHDEVAVLKPMA